MLSLKEVRRRKSSLQERCSECGSGEFVTDPEMGEVACRRCGLVLQEAMLDQRPEWTAFTLEEREEKSRGGPPSSLIKFDKGLSTTFEPYRNTHGRPLSTMEQLSMMRLRKWNIRARMHSSTERNLSQAMNVLTLLADKLYIPENVRESAALIYRRALDKELVRGRSIQGIAAASLYAACRLTRTPRSLKAMVGASNRSQKEISRCYRLIQRELEMTLPIDDPVKYVSKIAAKVKLSQRTQNLAIELLLNAKKVRVDVGKGPAGMAAATLYVATIMTGEEITQKTLAEAAEVTEVTVRNRYKGLTKDLDIKLKKGFKRLVAHPNIRGN